MVRGLFSHLKFPYVQFPCSCLNANTLYALVWECVSHLEMIGLKVLALTADGASCNRKFFKMHKCQAKTVPNKTPNFCADEECPFSFSVTFDEDSSQLLVEFFWSLLCKNSMGKL